MKVEVDADDHETVDTAAAAAAAELEKPQMMKTVRSISVTW